MYYIRATPVGAPKLGPLLLIWVLPQFLLGQYFGFTPAVAPKQSPQPLSADNDMKDLLIVGQTFLPHIPHTPGTGSGRAAGRHGRGATPSPRLSGTSCHLRRRRPFRRAVAAPCGVGDGGTAGRDK
jgi:hypothetical protein